MWSWHTLNSTSRQVSHATQKTSCELFSYWTFYRKFYRFYQFISRFHLWPRSCSRWTFSFCKDSPHRLCGHKTDKIPQQFFCRAYKGFPDCPLLVPDFWEWKFGRQNPYQIIDHWRLWSVFHSCNHQGCKGLSFRFWGVFAELFWKNSQQNLLYYLSDWTLQTIFSLSL